MLISLFLNLSLLLLVEFVKVLHFLFFKFDSVLLVLDHHSFQIFVHGEFLEFFDSLACCFGFVVSTFGNALLLVLSNSITKQKNKS